MYYTIEGRDTWNGDAFYAADGDVSACLFTNEFSKARKFDSPEIAHATARLLVKRSELDPFLGHECAEIVERDAETNCALRTVETVAFRFYRAP